MAVEQAQRPSNQPLFVNICQISLPIRLLAKKLSELGFQGLSPEIAGNNSPFLI